MICPKCGTSQTNDARFCFRCGASLASSAETIQDETVQDETVREETAESGRAKDPLVGATLEGKYHIEARLSAGGMGTVYRAARLHIGDEAAVKILHADYLADARARERFRREAQAAARLKHPNAVNIYDFGVTGEGLVYLVMELVEGESLRALIKREGAFSTRQASDVARQVCAALSEAHKRGIVHRDVKPDNIIVSETDEGPHVKVLDFGIAKLREDQPANNLTQAGSVMGTPHYMSPEQCMGEEIDGRSDIYSLGIVLYEMLTGRVPFHSNVSNAIVIQHVQKEPAPPRSHRPGLSQAVERVVLRALSKRPEQRQQTATELARELNEAVRLSHEEDALSSQLQETIAQTAAFPREEGELRAGRQSEGGAAGAELPPTVAMRTPPHAFAPGFHADNRSVETQQARLRSNSLEMFERGSGPTSKPKGARFMSLTLVALLVFAAATLGVGWMFWKSDDAGGASQDRATKGGSGVAQGSKADEAKASGASRDEAKGDEAEEATTEAPPGMVYVPGGEFQMGAVSGDEYERPEHTVKVAPFYMDVHEVTNEEYARFVRETGRNPPATWPGGEYRREAARRPVTGVSWDDAAAYAAWTGKRLPTEREWEYAARGKNSFRYPWGDEWRDGAANVARTSDTPGPTEVWRFLTDVGEASAPSPFGLRDMVGNAWEWTASPLKAYPGGTLPPNALQPGVQMNIIRGGCYMNERADATTTLRRGYAARGTDYRNTGFRCAKDATTNASR